MARRAYWLSQGQCMWWQQHRGWTSWLGCLRKRNSTSNYSSFACCISDDGQIIFFMFVENTITTSGMTGILNNY